MKKLFCFLVLFCAATSAYAQGSDGPVRTLSEEEMNLVQAFRRNPEPFRRILYSSDAGMPPHREHPQHPRILGPHDLIDVGVEGGSVAFFGKNYAYDPFSFRIMRGEEKEIVFRRQRSSSETRVVVSFRNDGLHFEVPESGGGPRESVRGMLVIGEDGHWLNGETIEQNDRINNRRSISRADHLTFRIKYAGEGNSEDNHRR